MSDLICPKCSSKFILVYRGVYLGSGYGRHGYEMECADCGYGSGWWSTLEECKARFI